MSKENGEKHSPNIGLLVGIGLGAGVALGLVLVRFAARRSHVEMVETVEQLRTRTQQVLDELSENVSDLITQTRAQVQNTGVPENSTAPKEMVDIDKERPF